MKATKMNLIEILSLFTLVNLAWGQNNKKLEEKSFPEKTGESEESLDSLGGHLDYCDENVCTLIGAVGDPGNKGITGTEGEKGEPGGDGDVGLPGLPGEPGAPGEHGDVGMKGMSGAKGEKGAPGVTGEQHCVPLQCDTDLSLGHCYGASSMSLSVKCRDGYAAAAVWRNTRFWGLRCCEIVRSTE